MADVHLPAPLARLVARVGGPIVRLEEVTGLAGRDGARRTFRVVLAGGRVVKARLLRDATVGERMARWMPMLAARGFAPLLAAEGAATVEAWVEGGPAPTDDDATAEVAGALLGACHGVLPPEEVRAGDARLDRWVDDALRWTEEVRRAGGLTDGHAARVRACALEARPPSATFGLYHGDFCAENLVVGPDGLVCVDDTTIGPEILEVDLGFVGNRWPMPSARRARFLAGYRRHADPSRFLRDERFWRLAAALRSAAWRVREGTRDADLPLREVRACVP